MVNQNENSVALKILTGLQANSLTQTVSNSEVHRRTEEVLPNTSFSTTDSKMDNSVQNLIKVIVDFTLLGLIGIAILILYFFVEPFERGFFCNDESLMHPYNTDTISTLLLAIVGITVTILSIVIIELVRGKLDLDEGHKLKLLRWNVPVCIQNLYKYIGWFLFGAACCQLTTDIAKYSIGRLRPHFISVCIPVMKDGTDCSNEKNLHQYIEDYTCSNSEATAKMLEQMRLSFLSGHSSFGFYSMVFCALYLQSRLSWRGSALLKHFLQFTFLAAAFYTGMSRISDYKHHWSDVLAGSVLGISVAVIVAYGLSDLFERKISREKLPMRHNAD